jgi:hypothetical protein
LVGARRVDVEAARAMEGRREEMRRMLEGEVPLPSAGTMETAVEPRPVESPRTGT